MAENDKKVVIIAIGIIVIIFLACVLWSATTPAYHMSPYGI